MRDQVPHQYKTTDKITVTYHISIFKVFREETEDKRF